ncbi:MAG: UDP-N-acetylglucosamine 1-carboxyvinyltransferase [Eubacteriales bacterium]|nr:UDP-N-acetylglucosamine 1-carboxyvinyltransferase [Eubacteriales bacterium]
MSMLVVEGGTPLEGGVYVHGAKNAALPILAATVLGNGVSVVHNCPNITDVNAAVNILNHLGCRAFRDGDSVIVDSSDVCRWDIPESMMREMRSSVMFLGAILARCGKADITYPGGCELGPRPIDLHLKALEKLSIRIDEKLGRINCRACKARGSEISLDMPSVGATENIMLAAVTAKGETVIVNAAQEPEIVDLQNFLNCMGAKIHGGGTNVITIQGVEQLYGCEYTVIPDRIETVTYMAAAGITGGRLSINNVIPEHVQAVASVMKCAGCDIMHGESRIDISAPPRLKSVDYIRTMPYPGFPTDAQAIIMAMLSVSQGVSVFSENIFSGRFKHVPALTMMGANIITEGRTAIVRGVNRLYGASVKAEDLRGAAALVVAALNAEGKTEISGINYLDRGYCNLENALSSVGANIYRCKKENEI